MFEPIIQSKQMHSNQWDPLKEPFLWGIKAIPKGKKRASVDERERGVGLIRLKVIRTHVITYKRFVKKLNTVGPESTYSLIKRLGGYLIRCGRE